MAHPKKLVRLLEAQMQEFASYNNVRKVLSHYGVNITDEKLERAVVVLVTEMKQLIHKWSEALPEDETEAQAKIERSKGPRGPHKAKEKKKPAYDLTEYEVIEFE